MYIDLFAYHITIIALLTYLINYYMKNLVLVASLSSKIFYYRSYIYTQKINYCRFISRYSVNRIVIIPINES